jgi:hypothetical protein
MELSLAGERRIELYTKSATVVVFATKPGLARKAAELIRPQEAGTTPVLGRADLRAALTKDLPPPAAGAMEGTLKCQT